MRVQSALTMINLQGITKDYATAAGPFTALREVELTIAAGEMVAVVGRSGSGKSTLLHLIGGIDTPSSGSIRVGGRAIQSLSENELAVWRGRNVGFVFQFFQLLPTLTALENVMLPMDFLRALPARDRRRRALELLERTGVADQADKLPSALSGGQQQRVAVARALANDPPVVLADEPTGNLDSVTAEAVLGLFRAMATAGTTVVLATHDRELGHLIDREVELADGVVVSNAATSRPERVR
ncbi:MAG: ABC transporter ATP-binding protein [Acidobacteriota bacterium]